MDLGDVELNHAVLNKVDSLATHVLVIMVRSIVNPLSYTFATFATSGISSYEFFPLFWRAFGILEGTCGLKVIAATADSASCHRSFFKMHEGYSDDGKVVYKTPNIFSDDERFIFFFSDAPHLMKTTRNCLRNSGSTSSSRFQLYCLQIFGEDGRVFSSSVVLCEYFKKDFQERLSVLLNYHLIVNTHSLVFGVW